MLKDFWFPILLALAGLVPLYFGEQMTGGGRRIMLTLATLCVFAGAIAYIWGDPVRGPFANLSRPHDSQNFTLRVGNNRFKFPVSRLKDGIDFSKLIHLQNDPIQLWVRKTWWSGLQVKVTLRAGGKDVVRLDSKELGHIDSNLDVNYDDYAFEMIDSVKIPSFQLEIAKDYEQVYVRARLRSDGGLVMLINDDGILTMPALEAKPSEYKLERIFKYPSSLHLGERNSN